MSEFEDKLNALLSNPDSMAQIMRLAQSLGGSAATGGGETPPGTVGGAQAPFYGVPPGTEQPISPPQGSASGSGLGDLFSGLGGLDPKLLARLLPLAREFSQGRSSQSGALLYALRPYLKAERQEKVERAVQLAHLIHIGKRFLSGGEE